MQRLLFLERDCTDDEMQAECAALRAGEYAGWELQHMSDDTPIAIPAPESRGEILREIWLTDLRQGGTEIVRLQRRPGQDVARWHCVSATYWLPGVF